MEEGPDLGDESLSGEVRKDPADDLRCHVGEFATDRPHVEGPLLPLSMATHEQDEDIFPETLGRQRAPPASSTGAWRARR